MKKYNIIFDGAFKPDYDPAEVRRNLADLLGAGEETLESLLSDGPVIVKGNVEQQTALHFHEALENAGAVCHIRPVEKHGAEEDLIQKLEKRAPSIESSQEPSPDGPRPGKPPAEPAPAVSEPSPAPEQDDADDSGPDAAPEKPPPPDANEKHSSLPGLLSFVISLPAAIIAGLYWISRSPGLSRELEALVAWKPPSQEIVLFRIGVAGMILCAAGIVSGSGGLFRRNSKKLLPALGVFANVLVCLCIAAGVFYAAAPASPPPEAAMEASPAKEEASPVEPPPSRMGFLAKKYSWMLRHTDAALKKSGSKRSNCLKPARQFISDAFRFIHGLQDRPSAKDLLTRGEALIQGRCGLSPVRLWLGMALYAAGDSEKAEPHARKAFSGLRRKGAPAGQSFLAARLLADIAMEAEGKSGESFEKWKSRAVESMADAIVSGEFSEGEARIAWSLMENAGESFDFDECFEMLRDEKGLDPWLLLMVEGEREIDAAWDMRGRGRAYTVTREGWKGFHKHLKRASDALNRAWTLRPSSPEAPTRMISVAMSRGDKTGKSMRMWFERAVEAQRDYIPAHEIYLTSLRPRWGGDYGKMHDFGLECLNGGRFDTDVPLFYLKALRKTGEEIEYSRWFAPFRDPMVEENLQRLFDGLLAAPERAGDRGRVRTCQALTQAWSGNYETAGDMLEALGDGVELWPGFLGEPLSWNGRGLDVVRIELRAFTGPLGKRLKMAESLCLHEKTGDALSLFEEILEESRGDAPLFEYLRERIALSRMGARPEKLAFRNSAVHIAARGSHIDVMRFLLGNGADVNGKNSLGDAPLHIAAYRGRDRMISFLLKNKADPNIRNNRGWTPLHQALAHGKAGGARLLMQNGAAVDAANNEGATPLHFALGYNLPGIAVEMIGAGPNIDIKDNEKDAPLHVALRGEESKAARMLVQKGADVNAQNSRGNSPLHIAVTLKLADMVRFLLENGADVNGINGENWPPLHLAVFYDDITITGLLLAHGADIHQRLTDGWTPLHLAVEYGRVDITRLLLKKGSDCAARLSDGRTAFLIAREKEDSNLVGILTEHIRLSGREEELQRLHETIKASREWVDRGFQGVKEKKPRIALEDFKRAEAADPDFVMGPYGMGLAYTELGEKEEAFRRFRRAMEVDPHHASPCVDWGSALMTSGRIVEGIRLYKKATEVDPKNTPANMTLFNYYINAKDCRKASIHFERIPREMPDWRDFRKKLGRHCPDS